MKTLLILCVVAAVSCKQESECDTIRRGLDILNKREAELKDSIPSYNNGKDMALVRVAVQKAALKEKLKKCEF